MVKGRFLRPETRDLLFASAKTSAGEETNYGLGWRIFKTSSGRRAYNHGGQLPGGMPGLPGLGGGQPFNLPPGFDKFGKK